jgi:hypothetical protein
MSADDRLEKGATYRRCGLLAVAVSADEVAVGRLGIIVLRKATRADVVSLTGGGEPVPSVSELARAWGVTLAELDAALAPFFAPVLPHAGKAAQGPSKGTKARRNALLDREDWERFRTARGVVCRR